MNFLILRFVRLIHCAMLILSTFNDSFTIPKSNSDILLTYVFQQISNINVSIMYSRDLPML